MVATAQGKQKTEKLDVHFSIQGNTGNLPKMFLNKEFTCNTENFEVLKISGCTKIGDTATIFWL